MRSWLVLGGMAVGSSSLPADDDWARAIFGASDIWQATLDLSRL